MVSGCQLIEINLTDDALSWERIGFEIVTENSIQTIIVGNTKLCFEEIDEVKGITSVHVEGIKKNVDSLNFNPTALSSKNFEASFHHNRIERIDHLVVTTPNPDRTTKALVKAGVTLSGIRTFGSSPNQTRQSFFWLGDVILELVGPHQAPKAGKPLFWGLALVSSDINETVRHLGDLCTPLKDAIQPGRKITTVKTRDLSIGVAIAIMSPHINDN
ncbi:hypothetical protein CL649_02630 [bacterium]|nr:hypothetical protein [bacterium]